MKIDALFISKLVDTMQNNRIVFCQDTVSLLQRSIKSYYRIGTCDILFGDNAHLNQIIESTIMNSDNPMFNGKRIVYTKKGLLNVDNDCTQQFYETTYIEFSEQILKEYWDNQHNQLSFAEFGRFPAFQNQQIDSNDWAKYAKSQYIFNTNMWMNYFNELISFFLKDFKIEKIKQNNCQKFTKEINGYISICIEYDYKNTLRCLKTGLLSDIKLDIKIVSGNDYKINEKRKTIANENSMTLFHGEHPIFFRPCIMPSRIAGRIALSNTTKGINNGIQMMGSLNFEHLPDGSMCLFNNDEDGEVLKKYYFFYLDIYTYYLSHYLNFIENCLGKIICN